MEPLFSIITVTFNAADTVGRTLESVDCQTFGNYEHLIIDGASGDNTKAVAEKYNNEKRRIVSEPDKGLYDAMNKGMALSSGKYLIFLNAGDKFHSRETLEHISEIIEENNFPGIVYGQTNIVDVNGKFVSKRHLTAPGNLTLKSFSDGMLVCHQSFVAIRDIVGTYNTEFRFSADYEWCIRCLQHSRNNVSMGDEVLVDYLDEGITTSNRFPSLMERFRIMCFYYGTFPTVLRHVKFLFRWWMRNKKNKR